MCRCSCSPIYDKEEWSKSGEVYAGGMRLSKCFHNEKWNERELLVSGGSRPSIVDSLLIPYLDLFVLLAGQIGLALWAGLLGALLIGGALLVYNTSALS